MSKPDYDTTLARIAGNIAAALTQGEDGYFGAPNERNHVATMAVDLARAIAAEVERTDQEATHG